MQNGAIAILGATATGKTALAMAMSRVLQVEVISADARQVYRGLDIGTAKPNPDDLRRVPHHFIDILDPTEDYSAGEFAFSARQVFEEIRQRERIPIIVGGSGLYVRGLVDGFADVPPADRLYRAMLERELTEGGEDALREKLKIVDPDGAVRIQRGKTRALVRALEVHHVTGRAVAGFHAEQKQKKLPVLKVILESPRPQLYSRINRRTVEMFENGLVPEVRGLLKLGYGIHLNALNTVGYKEVIDMIEGRTSESEAIARVQMNTRRYAKRQVTWLRREEQAHRLDAHSNSTDRLCDEVLRLWKSTLRR